MIRDDEDTFVELNNYLKPAMVAQLDACPTGDQEVVSSTPPWTTTFFRGD